MKVEIDGQSNGVPVSSLNFGDWFEINGLVYINTISGNVRYKVNVNTGRLLEIADNELVYPIDLVNVRDGTLLVKRRDA
jgi:glutamine cyclotransferase